MAKSNDHGLSELLKFSRERADEMLRAALEAFDAQDLSRAETILVSLITLDGSDPRPLKLLASTVMLQGKQQQAEQLYQRAYELDPKDAYTLVALGELKLKTLRIDQAVPLFERLFALDPKGMHPAANRGREIVQAYYDKLSRERGE